MDLGSAFGIPDIPWSAALAAAACLLSILIFFALLRLYLRRRMRQQKIQQMAQLLSAEMMLIAPRYLNDYFSLLHRRVLISRNLAEFSRHSYVDRSRRLADNVDHLRGSLLELKERLYALMACYTLAWARPYGSIAEIPLSQNLFTVLFTLDSIRDRSAAGGQIDQPVDSGTDRLPDDIETLLALGMDLFVHLFGAIIALSAIGKQKSWACIAIYLDTDTGFLWRTHELFCMDDRSALRREVQRARAELQSTFDDIEAGKVRGLRKLPKERILHWDSDQTR